LFKLFLVFLTWGSGHLFLSSLGLTALSYLMLFDSIGLLISLFVILSKHLLKPTPIFSYGYDRIEVLAGFSNSIFLTFMSFFCLF